MLAAPSWVGVEPRWPVPRLGHALLERVIAYGTPLIGVVLVSTMLSKGSINLLALLPPILVAGLVYAVYAWRGLTHALARVRGQSGDMPLLSRLWRHYLGYAAALGAGVLAVWGALSASQLVMVSAFVAAGLVAKLLVDLALPQPLPKPQPLSLTFLNLMLMSPLWFGLPWGFAVAAVFAVSGFGEGMPLEDAAVDASIIVAPVAVGSVAVFALLTLIAAAIELATDER
jgi:hypothetical protein